MSRLIILIVFVLAIAATFSTIESSSQLHLQGAVWSRSAEANAAPGALHVEALKLPLAVPVRLDGRGGDAIHVEISGRGADYVTVLNVVAAGGITITALTDAAGRTNHCGSVGHALSGTGPGPTLCRLTVRLSNDSPQSVVISADTNGATVTKITADVASAKQHSAASGEKLLLGFGVLFAVGPLLVWLRRWRNADRFAQIALGLGWIATTGWFGFAINLAFALAGYGLYVWIARKPTEKLSAPFFAITCVAIALVFVKFVAPYISTSFGNPGGFWLVLPLGISYFAIRIVDLLLSAHSGAVASISLRDYLAFLFMPFTLPAGPILTYRDFLTCRIQTYSIVDIAAGAARMAVGVTKKYVADALILPQIYHVMFSFLEGGKGDTPLYVAAMLLANTLYVYLDFSAYCDLAIGSGRAAGYRIPENFDWPLLRSSLRRFWQHWHMTLTNWVMRRLYFPAFLSSRSTFLSMLASMLVIGFWHSPTLTWAMWAFHHAGAMSVEAQLFSVSALKSRVGKAARPWPAARGTLTYIGGVAFVWLWVSLGQSFTMFSAPLTALECYATALMAPIELVREFVPTTAS